MLSRLLSISGCMLPSAHWQKKLQPKTAHNKVAQSWYLQNSTKKKTFFFFPSTKPPSNKHNIQASASHFITQLIGINKHVIHHRLVSWLLWKISKVCRQQDEAQDQKIDKGEKENGSGEEICEMGSKTWKYGNMGLHVGSAVSHMKQPQSQNKSNPIYLWISYLETIQ